MSAHGEFKIVGGLVVGGHIRVKRSKGYVPAVTRNQAIGCISPLPADEFNRLSSQVTVVSPESLFRAHKAAEGNSTGSRASGDHEGKRGT